MIRGRLRSDKGLHFFDGFGGLEVVGLNGLNVAAFGAACETREELNRVQVQQKFENQLLHISWIVLYSELITDLITYNMKVLGEN